MNKKIKITRGAQVEAPKEDQKLGVMAFQVVNFIIEYFGNTIETSHDTIIKSDGTQTVIGGCGFIPHGFDISAL